MFKLLAIAAALILSSANSLIEYLAHAQSATNAMKQGRDVNVEPLCPLTHAERFAIKFQHPIRSYVSSLLLGRCPPTIPGFVVAVVVDAVDRHADRSFTHVRQEVREVAPPLAHNDALSAVSIPAPGIWVVAPSNHRLPCAVGCGTANRVSVDGGAFFPKASAGFCSAIFKLRWCNNCFSATVTPATPSRSAGLGISCSFDNTKTIEALSSNVYQSAKHDRLSKGLRDCYFITNPNELVARDSVDLAEVNHFYDENGRLVFDQLIAWDWDGSRFQVRDWRLIKSESQIPQPDPAGGYSAMWLDGEVMRRVHAKAFRETWS